MQLVCQPSKQNFAFDLKTQLQRGSPDHREARRGSGSVSKEKGALPDVAVCSANTVFSREIRAYRIGIVKSSVVLLVRNDGY